MATSTLGNLVTAVRAECGHALTATQGVNALETIKYLIERTQYELWTSFQWPQLIIRRDILTDIGQHAYQYPAEIDYDQVREMWYYPVNSTRGFKIEFGVPEECITVDNANTREGPTPMYWDVYDENRFRVWPTSSEQGTIKVKGMRHLNPLVDNTDYCTLDPTLIVLRVAEELLTRAKSADAQSKGQAFQRHLQKLLGNKVSAKMKVSTFGAIRHPTSHNYRPGIDYIPGRY